MVHTAEHRDPGKVNLENILTTCLMSETEALELRYTNVIVVATPISLFRIHASVQSSHAKTLDSPAG